MAPADQHERVAAVISRADGVAQPSHVGDQRLGREFDSPRWGSEHLGQSRLQRPQVDAVWRGLEPLQGEPVGVGAERVAVRSEPKHHVEASFVAGAVDKHCGQFVDRAAGDG